MGLGLLDVKLTGIRLTGYNCLGLSLLDDNLGLGLLDDSLGLSLLDDNLGQLVVKLTGR